MMGERRVMQEALFYGFSLERHVPDNHLLRKIDRFVDLSEVRRHLEPYYSETGRPSMERTGADSTALATIPTPPCRPKLWRPMTWRLWSPPHWVGNGIRRSPTISSSRRKRSACVCAVGSSARVGSRLERPRMRSKPGPPMTPSNMRKNGVRAVTATCETCRREADVTVDALPETLTVPEAGQRLRCSQCGAKTISTRPAWHTGTHRPGTPDYHHERPPMS